MLPRLLLSIAAATLITSCSILPQGSPLVRGAKPFDYGKIGAGEGPAYKDGVLYFTDGKGINQLVVSTGKASVFRSNCGSPNGLMFRYDGSLVACETTGRRVVLHDGGKICVMREKGCVVLTNLNSDPKTQVLAARYNGHRFNSPNDLTQDSRGHIYFTDPRYGPRDTMEIRDARGRLVEGVYRINAQGDVTLILGPDDVERPNGILITPDDRFLYIADNNNNTHGGSRRLLRFTLNKDGTVKPGTRKVIFDWKGSRGPDGIKMDKAGRLYVAAGVNKANQWETDEFKAGCYIISPSGKLLDFVPTCPDEATNCALAGPNKKTLFITSGNHLWSVPLK